MTATELRLPRGDLERALRMLPSLHADAYRLQRSGVDELSIAIHLEIPVEDVGSVLREAERQLERLADTFE